VDLSLESDFN